MDSATLLPSFSRDPYLLLADADVILWFVLGIPHHGYIHLIARHALFLEIILIFNYLRHRFIAALGGGTLNVTYFHLLADKLKKDGTRQTL